MMFVVFSLPEEHITLARDIIHATVILSDSYSRRFANAGIELPGQYALGV